MTSPRLVVLDSVMVDVLVRVASLPSRGSDSLASDALVTTGGGFTVAAAASRHGLTALYAGRLGTGPLSEAARTALAAQSITVPVDADPDHDAGFCLVMVDDDGERTFVTAKGAELSLRRTDLDGVAITAGDYLYLSGYNLVYPEIGDTVAGWVHDLPDGVVVAFDPGARVSDIPVSLRTAVTARTNWLLCNEAEARALTGEADVDVVANTLLAMTGGDGVVIHAGRHGCWVVTPSQACVRVAGFPAVAVDTNGAGDTHNGVFLAELARGADVMEAARRANAAAAIAVEGLGPSGVGSRDDVLARVRGGSAT